MAWHNHTLFILHILTYYDFLRILLCSEICIDTEETDVGNVLFIYHMLLHFVQREKELGCLKKLHVMDLIKFLIWTIWCKCFSFFSLKVFSLNLPLTILVDDEVMFLNCSIIVNFLCVMKSCLGELKCLHVVIGFLVSFLWLFKIMRNSVLDFPTCCILQFEHSSKWMAYLLLQLNEW